MFRAFSFLRDYIENVRRNHEQIIDNVNLDTVLFAGYDVRQEETASRVIETFREFIQEKQDEITALRIIYDQRYKDRPMAIAKLKALYEKLKARNITVDRLWDCCRACCSWVGSPSSDRDTPAWAAMTSGSKASSRAWAVCPAF